MKTIEEAAKEHNSKCIKEGEDNEVLFGSRAAIRELNASAFNEGVEFAQKWIPVEEELPNSDVPGSATSEVVLAKSEELEKEVTAYSHLVNKTWHIYPSGKIITITHWRPIECN